MRRYIAICLLVVFATLVTTDAIACPDDCRSATTPSEADPGRATSACVFCTGGAVLFTGDVVVTHFIPSLPVSELPLPTPPWSLVTVPDRPPRTV